MARTIELPDAVLERIQALGGGLFTTEEVIARLVDTAAEKTRATSLEQADGSFQPFNSRSQRSASLGMRAPRTRGATVEVNGARISAVTVRDLYEQVFRMVFSTVPTDKVMKLIPYSTSGQRYLIAREPTHPNGNTFFVPLKVGQYYAETHKNYETAVKQLSDFLAKLGVELRYLG